MSEQLIKSLRAIKADWPEPTAVFTEVEKDAFINKHGFHLVRDLNRAKKELPVTRIPHLFSSVDTQIVVDVLANEWQAALQRASKKKS